MHADLLELIGLVVAVLGWATICAAAALVAVALCVLLAGIGLLFTGGIAVYVANHPAPKVEGARS